MHHTSLIAILVAGFGLAFIFGALAQRLRLSPLVGYLVAGIIAGPFTPCFVGDQTLAPQLSE
ncbi:MAG TPA: cation:proton antiporter, partial [Lysobacter sp.]|nr:cation:proton antiporter [Lysobacter sp.]